jgi:hypothetical protein
MKCRNVKIANFDPSNPNVTAKPLKFKTLILTTQMNYAVIVIGKETSKHKTSEDKTLQLSLLPEGTIWKK